MKPWSYPCIPQSVFDNEPEYLGGDGTPGFVCPRCSRRRCVFDVIKSTGEVGGNTSSATLRWLRWRSWKLISKKGGSAHYNYLTGVVVGQVQTCTPVYDGVSAELISLFLKLKNDGVYDKESLDARPESRLPVQFRGEGSALSNSQLTGIWVVSFSFAFIHLIVAFLTPAVKRCRKKNVQAVIGYNQTGKCINLLGRGDSWLNDKTFVTSTRRFVMSGSNSNDFLEPPGKIYTTGLNDDSHDDSSSRLGDTPTPAKSPLERNPSSSTTMANQPRESRPENNDDDDEFNSQNGRNYRYL